MDGLDKWDVFISYAHEDYEAVAAPLASRLTALGIRVWLDKSELRIGDSLRERIDDGLLNSTFAIVIVSPAFFSRYWTRTELDGLVQRESGTRKVILPVWHRVAVEDVAGFSPTLAGRIAARTAEGLESVAEAVTREVASARSASMNPSAFEGIWRATPSRLVYCLKLISGELRVGFGAADGSAIHGQCYECRIVGPVLLCRFEYFESADVSGFFALRHTDPDTLAGGWCYKDELFRLTGSGTMSAVRDRLVSLLTTNTNEVRQEILVRDPAAQLPDWAREYFQRFL